MQLEVVITVGASRKSRENHNGEVGKMNLLYRLNFLKMAGQQMANSCFCNVIFFTFFVTS